VSKKVSGPTRGPAGNTQDRGAKATGATTRPGGKPPESSAAAVVAAAGVEWIGAFFNSEPRNNTKKTTGNSVSLAPPCSLIV
jgi:hypothetical protein